MSTPHSNNGHEGYYDEELLPDAAFAPPLAPPLATEECRDCDGCGWVEGGVTLKTTCATCGGTGEVAA